MSRWNLSDSERVTATSKALRQLEATLRSSVADARSAGLSWQDVADALGTARQSAWRKFKEGTMQTSTVESTRVCSFCGYSQAEVEHLIVAPTGAGICGGCFDVAARMLNDSRGRRAKKKK